MTSAINTLKNYCDYADTQETKGGFMTAKDEQYLISTIRQAIREHEEQLKAKNERIRELEEAIKPKKCLNCIAYDKDGNCKENVRISNVQGVPLSFYCKWHEPKDNA